MTSQSSTASQSLMDREPTTPIAPVPEPAGVLRDRLEAGVSRCGPATGPPADAADAGRWVGILRRLCTAKLRYVRLEEFADDVNLLVSELVTNALRHGRTDAEPQLSVVFTSERIAIAVDDHSALRPALSVVAEDSESGRGLLLVDALADAWGVSPDGTTTRAVLNVTGQRS